MSARWYVVRTKPRAEFLAARELEHDGVEVFSPTITKPLVHTGTITTPLFPGYIFLRWEPEIESWPIFRYGQHVLGLVNFRDEVPWLEDEAIADLKQRCDRINQEGGIWRRYQRGDRVRIVSSTMETLAQVVEDGNTPQSRVKVLLQFLNRSVPAQVPRENIQPVDEMPERNTRAPRRTRGKGRWLQGFGPRALATG